MNTNNHNNEKKNTITRRMKIAHNSLPETDMKAHMEPKWRKLANIRSEMLVEKEKQLEERGIQLMVTQHKKNKPGIKYDDTIDIEPEDEKE
ncbi:hypothetical protein HpDR37_14470 [Helicobacter pylori]